MNVNKISLAVAVICLSIAGTSYAADSTSTTAIVNANSSTPAETKAPLSQSTTSVQKNLTRDADSKGLNNASNRLESNQDKIEARKAERAEKRLTKAEKAELKKADKAADKTEDAAEHSEKHADKAERAEKRTDKAERTEKAERVEKTERVEKAERPQKVERPEKTGPGR